jgi:outer membrane receptor for ferrienterochelin and colicins
MVASTSQASFHAEVPMSAVGYYRRMVVLMLCLVAIPLAAQTGTITGTVKDSTTGSALFGAQVTAYRSNGGVGGVVTTNESGAFRIGNLPNDTYTLHVLHIGHAPATISGVMVSGSTVSVDVVMGRANMLSEIVVSTTRGAVAEKVLDAPASVSVVNTQEIETRPSLTTTDHLRSTPGVDISQGGIVQSNVVARGFNNIFSGSLLTLQDYRFASVPSLRVNVPFLATGTNEDIERIEVLLGPASALYGPNSANGVLHVITKSPFASVGTSLTLDGGTHSILRMSARHAGIAGENVGFKISGEYMRGRDFEYIDPAEPTVFPSSAPPGRAGEPNVRNFDVERFTTEGRLDLRLDQRTEAVTTVGFTKDLGGIELTGANGAAFAKNWTYTSVQERIRRGRFFAQAFANFSNAGNDTLTSLRGTYLLRTGQPIVDKSRVFAAQAQHGFGFRRSNFTYGVDYVFTNPRTGHTINGQNEDIDDVTEYGGYIQGNIPLAPKWEFVGAARLDKHSEVPGQQFSPRAALMFRPVENQNLRLTYNRSFSTPANFAYFLDLLQASNAGGSGFDVRAVGNHGGHEFDRSCSGAGFGSFCMRSVYTGDTPVPASASAAYQGLITARAPAIQAGVQSALSANPQLAPNAAALAAAIVNGLKAATPTNADLATHVAYLLAPSTILSPEQLSDIGPLKAGYNNTYELGYKGLIGSKGRLSIDVWHQIRGDINPPAAVSTPSVFTDSASYYAVINANVTATLTPIFTAQGLPPAQAAGTAAAVAAQLAPVLAGQLRSAPLGTVTFADQNRPDVLFTYYSVSKQTVNVTGIDVGYDWMLTPVWTIAGTYSWQDKNVFNNIQFSSLQGGNGKPYMSNSPKHKATLAFRYANDVRGLGAEIRGRYADAFPVNSGVYVSDLTLNGPSGAYRYDHPPVIATLDLGVNWRVPLATRRATISLNGTNVLNNKRRTFSGTPEIGALWLTRLSYQF